MSYYPVWFRLLSIGAAILLLIGFVVEILWPGPITDTVFPIGALIWFGVTYCRMMLGRQ